MRVGHTNAGPRYPLPAPDRDASDQMARVARISASRGSARTLALAARMSGSRRAIESDVQRSA